MEENIHVVQYGWRLSPDSSIEPVYPDDCPVVYAATESEAVTVMMQHLSDSYKYYVGRDENPVLTESDVKVTPSPQSDVVEFDGATMLRMELSSLIQLRSREQELKELIHDESVQYCHILRRGSYWRSHKCGYTEQRHEAGVYTKHDAIYEALHADDLRLIPIRDIRAHNDMIRRAIAALESNLIVQ